MTDRGDDVLTKCKQDDKQYDNEAAGQQLCRTASPFSLSGVVAGQSAKGSAPSRADTQQAGSALALRLRDAEAAALPALPGVDREDRIAVVCDGVIDIAAALFNVPGRELRSPGRSPLAVSRVRQIAMYVTHVTLRLTMRDVGQGFGRDRTTVLYACHLIEDLREDEEFDDIVARVELVVMVAFGMRVRQD